MSADNKGMDPTAIEELRGKMKAKKQNYLLVESDDNSDEFVNFYFIGIFEGKETIYDAALYTLRLHYNSEIYEIAEHKAAKHFPNFSQIKYEEDENGDLEVLNDKEEEIGLFMAEIIAELEEEDEVKVQEHVEIDPNVDFGIGLDICLNVESIDSDLITRVVNEYNEDSLHLDDTLYSFQTESEYI